MKKLLILCVLTCSMQLNAQIVEEYSYPLPVYSLTSMILIDLESEGQKWMHRIMAPAINSGPYCDTSQMTYNFPSAPGCAPAVCEIDPMCCFTTWDGACAALALTTPECEACLSTAPGNSATRKVQLLNLDYTLFVEIDCSTFPNATPSYTFFTALYFSQYLFDDDDEVEFLFSYFGSPSPSYSGIYNQDGTLLAGFQGAHISTAIPNTYHVPMHPIHNTTNGAVLQLIYENAIKFYSLPGTLYDPCCNSDNTGIPTHNPPPLPVRGMNNAFPNPTYGAVTIDYELPPGTTAADLLIINSAGQTVKTYRISSVVNRVNLDLSGLAPGNYFYRISGSNGDIGTQKLIKL